MDDTTKRPQDAAPPSSPEDATMALVYRFIRSSRLERVLALLAAP